MNKQEARRTTFEPVYAAPLEGGGSPAKEPPPRWVRTPLNDEEGGDAPVFEAAVAWIEQNQTLALLSAFATGVFIGVLMRR